jgi:hypothetical protein
MKPETTGSISVTLPLKAIAPVTPAAAYHGVAESLMHGVQLLASSPHAIVAHAFLSAHIVECLLKAFLSKDGVSEKELGDSNLRHNLAELWRQAAARGLGISPPAWAQWLSDLHDRPFHLRYAKGIHGVSNLPNPQTVSPELTTLLQKVRERIRQES